MTIYRDDRHVLEAEVESLQHELAAVEEAISRAEEERAALRRALAKGLPRWAWLVVLGLSSLGLLLITYLYLVITVTSAGG
jgi:hypothetical protein